jgi:hypothetical protein
MVWYLIQDARTEIPKIPYYGRFLGGKWSKHENRKSEIRKSENRKSTIC